MTTIQGLSILIDSLLAANWVSTSGREPKLSENRSLASQLRPPTSQPGLRGPQHPWTLLSWWDRGCTVKPWGRCPGKAWPPRCPRRAAFAGASPRGRAPRGSSSPKGPPGFWRRLCFWGGSCCAAVFCVRGGCCPSPRDRRRSRWPVAWRPR